MKFERQQQQQLDQLCHETDPAQGFESFQQGLADIFPEVSFSHVLSRGGWHRLGGVVDAEHKRIADNIAYWAEQISDGDAEELILKYMDKGYLATNLAGKTHYFSAVIGEQPGQYLQLEIEELQEVVDRPLVIEDWFPDNLEEFLDPLDFPRLQPEPVGQPWLVFRRLTDMDQLIFGGSLETSHLRNIRRFLADWHNSSAGEQPFCKHWILALREYVDRDGEPRVNAKPVAAFYDAESQLPDIRNCSGSELAHAIHHYDRALGYHFSWFFMMLASKSENYTLADAVLRDLMGAYDYLAAKDLKVLREWESRPYSV
ncbi:MAG: hypothetical protein AB2813_08215 [Candidatus Sedimenticola endophacoides]